MIKRTLALLPVLVLAMTLLVPLYAAAQERRGPLLDPGQVQREPQTAQPSPSQPATTPIPAQTQTVTPQPQGAGNAAEGGSGTSAFVPLTNLPGLTQTANAESLASFFNNLYKLCIGAAAVIAILQIMRAGTYFFFNKGSVAHNVKAKELITNSVLGLLLVLSPVLIFNIINPDILHLSLNVSRLGTPRVGSNEEYAPITIVVLKTATDPLDASEVPDASDRARARAFSNSCTTTGGGTVHVRRSSAPIHCPGDQTPGTLNCANAQLTCQRGVTETVLSTAERVRCQVQYSDITVIVGSGQCNVTNGLVSIPSTCCGAGNTCCGKPKNTAPTPQGTTPTR